MNQSICNNAQNWNYWDGTNPVPQYTSGYIQVIDPRYTYWPVPYEVTKEPQICMGKAHVFECDHESSCKCGKITRVMEKK